MHVHFVGVAGTGMGALAGLFKASGHDVSGSDVAFYPPMGPALERWGIRLMPGFDPQHLVPRPDLVIVGNVCRPTNPEARAAIDGGIPVKSMPHALADHLLTHRSPLVVAGTHGKTTTSALCAWLLHEAGRDPGFLIGGIPQNFEQSFRLSRETARGGRLPQVTSDGLSKRNTPFVVEGDEYDTAFFEKTPKFWHYQPDVGIVTSIEHDHVDIYPDEASYIAAFQGFVERIPESGLIVASAADKHAVEIVQRSARAEVAYFALEGDDTNGVAPHWLGAPAEVSSEGQTFDVYAGGVYAGRAAMTIPGRHNVRNALAAIAAAAQGYGAKLSTLFSALATFRGIKRRQELLYELRGVRVYDDFAHHPTAVDETLRAMRSKFAKGTLWAVFEPRSATACRALHQDAYAQAFGVADRVVFAPLGRSEIPPSERLDLDALVRGLEGSGKRAIAASSVEAIMDLITKEAQPGDTVLLMSNGAFGGIYEKLRVALSA